MNKQKKTVKVQAKTSQPKVLQAKANPISSRSKIVPLKVNLAGFKKEVSPKKEIPLKVGLTKVIPVTATPIRTKSDIRADKVIKDKIKKKKLPDLPPEHETYFVYLKNPLEYRRQLLESSRRILFCLKSYQKILLIRQKKLEEIKNLKTSVRELLYLNTQFNEKLPKYNTGFMQELPTKDKSASRINASKKPADTKHEKTELDKLEESLANIEQKLKTLQ